MTVISRAGEESRYSLLPVNYVLERDYIHVLLILIIWKNNLIIQL